MVSPGVIFFLQNWIEGNGLQNDLGIGVGFHQQKTFRGIFMRSVAVLAADLHRGMLRMSDGALDLIETVAVDAVHSPFTVNVRE